MIKNLLLKRPFVAVFDVTKRCNSKCNMCSIWKHPSKISDELNLDDIKRVFTDLKLFGISQVLLQGGEPLLRKDIFEIIELMISLGLKPSLITNGILLNHECINRLSRMKCNVSISFDSLKRDVYKKIRGVDAFSIVKQNILYASKVKNKAGSWFINSTISEVNHAELIPLYEFAKTNSFYFSAYPYNYSLCKASASSDDLVFKNKGKVIDSFNLFLKRAVHDKDLMNELISKEIINYLRGDFMMPCDALRYSLMINEKGDVGPCIELSQEFSLKSESIFKLWLKLNRERVRKCYVNTPCFYGCTRTSGILLTNWFNILNFCTHNYKRVKGLLSAL